MVAASAQRPIEEKQVFHVDHPFWFAIMDDTSGAVLFQPHRRPEIGRREVVKSALGRAATTS